MIIQLLIIFLSLLFLLLLRKCRLQSCKKKYYYTLFVSILCILQLGLRNVAVGPDTYAYYLKFQDVINTSWNEIFYNFYKVYALNEGKDPGYPLIQKVFQIFSTDYQLFLLFVAIVFIFSLGRFVYYNTLRLSDIFIVLLVYQVLFWSFFASGIRQTLATFFTLIAVESIKRKKILFFSVLIILGSFIHKSIFIFFPFYFFVNYFRGKTLLLLSILLFPFVLSNASRLATLLATLSQSDQYMMYADGLYDSAGARNFSIMLMLIALWTLFLIWRKQIDDNFIAVKAISLAIFFTPLTWVDGTLMRVVQYYSIFLLILLPSLINVYRLSRRFMLFVIITIFFIVMIIRQNYSYAFFWEYMKLGNNYLY